MHCVMRRRGLKIYREFPPIKIYTRRFILLIGSHRKTLGISISRDERRQG